MSYSIYIVIYLCKQISSLIQDFGYFVISSNTMQRNSDGSNNKAQDYVNESMDVYGRGKVHRRTGHEGPEGE